MLVTNAQLRSNVATSPDGALIVDLTQLGDLDEAGRRLLAAQVVLSLAEVSVGRVRLLADGAPLLPDRSDLTRDDVASLIAEPAPTTVPALVVYDGRVHQLNGQLDTALPGPIGNGEVAVQSAASSPDGRRVAVVAADGPRRRLLVGGAEGAAAPVGLEAGTMTRPSWAPTGSEVWTVLDATTVGPGGARRRRQRARRPGRRQGADRTGGRSRTCGCPATACAWRPWCAAGSTPPRWPAARTATSRSATSGRCGRRTWARSSRWTGGRPRRSWR